MKPEEKGVLEEEVPLISFGSISVSPFKVSAFQFKNTSAGQQSKNDLEVGARNLTLFKNVNRYVPGVPSMLFGNFSQMLPKILPLCLPLIF